MLRRLDRWVWLGGAALAVNGGIVNAVGLSSLAHQTVSHVTGTTTLLTLAIARGESGPMMRLGAILGSFVAGAALSGFIVRRSTLHPGRRYGVALGIECGLLALALAAASGHRSGWLCLASAACGLQNAMASTYSGTVLRTTHMTGIVTDLGAEAGYFLRGDEVDGLRVRFYLTLLCSFMCGAAAGGLLFDLVSYRALAFPVAITGALALVYGCWLRPRLLEAQQASGS